MALENGVETVPRLDSCELETDVSELDSHESLLLELLL